MKFSSIDTQVLSTSLETETLSQDQDLLYDSFKKILEELHLTEKDESSPSESNKTRRKEDKGLHPDGSFYFSSPSFHHNVVTETTLNATTAITPEVAELLEKLGAELYMIHEDGITKTTLLFSSSDPRSCFQGAEITIEEFSTAPKIFNVTIAADAQALGHLHPHLTQFMQIFQERKFPFSINRIDTGLKPSSHHLVHRKEKAGDDGFDRDQKGNEST